MRDWRIALVAPVAAVLVGAAACSSGGDTEGASPTVTSANPISTRSTSPGTAEPPVTPGATTTSPGSTTAPAAEIFDVVASLSAGSEVGFAPEVLASINDPSLILPSDAIVEPQDGTLDIAEDLASVDAVVRSTGQPDERYWVFLERRDGAWMVYMTVPLSL